MTLTKRWTAAIALSLLGIAAVPRFAAAQCVNPGNNRSCVAAAWNAGASAPTGQDFKNKFFVVGSYSLNAICGRASCKLELWAATQPTGGLRIAVGGAQPTTSAQCSTSIAANTTSTTASTINSSFNSTLAVTVWVCVPLDWTTVPNSSSPSFVFRITQ